MESEIEIVKGNITHMDVDAIVNAANQTLLGGGGVDGAIHRAAGAELLNECRTLNGCPTGEAKITRGYNLSARWVIHTVGPVWAGGNNNEENLLASCYINCFRLVKKYKIRTVAFPAISTGAYRFPLDLATRIALIQTRKFLFELTGVEKIVFVCFDDTTIQSYRRTHEALENRS